MRTAPLTAITALALLWGLACNNQGWDSGDTDADTDTDADADTDTDVDTDTDSDTGPVGTDNDGDSWTAEGGDCDDDDVWVNPSWDENGSRSDDGKDNDCDGRIDEEYAGVVLLKVDWTGATMPQLVGINTLGDKIWEVSLTESMFAEWSDENLERDGLVFWDQVQLKLFDVKMDGTTTVLLDLSEVEWPEEGGPLGFMGLATHHAGGFYLISGIDRLFKIAPDSAGGWDYEEVAGWTCLEEDGSHELAPMAITANRATGEVALFGFFGGMGFWHPDTGYRLVTPGNAEEPAYVLRDAQAYGAKGYFALGQDTATGEEGIFRWNDNQQKLVMRGSIPDSDFSPKAFAVEEETGDFYFSSNPGQWRTVWRMTADGSYATQLYPGGSDPVAWPVSPDHQFTGVGILWDEAE